MKLVTHKSKNLLYRIQPFNNCTVDFQTSYAVLKQTTADAYSLSFKGQLFKGVNYAGVALFSGEPISSVGKFTKTFTTPSTLPDHNTVTFGLNGATNDTTFKCEMDLKHSTTYTFTCNFTNITQGSISWKDMMLVEGSTVGDYEPYSYNLLNKWHYVNSFTAYGNIYTNSGDGSWYINSLNGTANSYNIIGEEFPVTAGHKMLLRATYPFEGGQDFNGGYFYCTGQNSFEINTGTDIYPIPDGVTTLTPRIFVNLASRVDEKLYTPQVYDLTLMYGAGKEPTTVDQFYTDHPELKVSPLGFIGLKNLEISNKNIKRLRYKTWNNSLNLIDKSNFRSSDVGSGVTFTNNGDGSWTVNGTATSQNYFMLITEWMQLNTSHKYLLSGCPKEGSSDLFLYVDHGGSLFDYDTGNGSIGTPTKNSGTITIAVWNNTAVNNAIFKPQLYDLTEIYGAGNEPATVEQFYTDYPLAKTSPLGFSDLGIIPSNSGYILNQYNNLSEELLEENVEKDNINYHIPDKTNILLDKVEGKTNKIVQLADKSNYDDTSTVRGITFTNNGNGTITINGTNDGTDYSVHPITNSNYLTNDWLKGRKYLFYFSDRTDLNYYAVIGGSTSKIEYTELGNTSTGRSPLWAILSPTDNSIGGNSWYILRVKQNATCTNELASPQVFDLTAMYGFGNEPTTVEQFKKDYPQFFDEKLDGIWNVRTSGISTTGKNLFDINKWITHQYDVGNGTLVERLSNGVICQGDNGTDDGAANYSNGWFRPMYYQYPNSVYLQAGTYTLSADYTMIENSFVNTAMVNCYLYGDNNYPGSAFTSAPVGSTVKVKNTYTVEEGYYYPIFTLNSGKVKIENIQIELNSTATTYEPYTENKIDLLSTQTLNGINGVNDSIEVIDKGNGLYDLKKTQNIDSVDLGTLDWVVDGSNFSSSSISSVIKTPTNDSVGNYVCQKYVNCAISKSFVDGDFGVNSSGYLYFRNSAYTTATAFKTAVNGVILYYQLKTPVITTIATNLTYNQVSAIRTNGGLLLVNDNNNQKYVLPDVIMKENYQYKN